MALNRSHSSRAMRGENRDGRAEQKNKHIAILRRANGREVKRRTVDSYYKAKQVQDSWEEIYDDTYYVEIVKAR